MLIANPIILYIISVCHYKARDFLTDVYNESYQRGFLPESQRLAFMSLNCKRGHEDNIENYRPISLTNVDYRILAFTLAQRMHKIIGSLISNDQSAYIKGRYMGTNIRLVTCERYYRLF